MKTSFRFSPKILARLGEELNQSFDQSVLELVKNAYDADANQCVIELNKTASLGGTVIVSDDGDGMEPSDISDGWLVLGRSKKTADKLTTKGRTPAGSKGLGRLAALRMGTDFRLSSIPKSNSRRLHQLSVAWSAFDSADVVEDVPLAIETKKNTDGGHGTRIELCGLRASIPSDDVRKMARALLLLTDPFGDKGNSFKVELVAPEFKEIEALVRQKYFDVADFHLKAELNTKGIGTAQVLDWQGKELARTNLTSIRRGKNKGEPYQGPVATFDLWIFLLGGDNEQFSARKVSATEIRKWLQAFGGVHVYQDDIRVTPYGNPGNDWLEMNLARARSPEERPSTNTSIGRVQVSGKGNHVLRQKTDRTGFIEDDSFIELKAFINDSLGWLARWRLELAEKRRGTEKKETPRQAALQKERVEVAIAKAPKDVQKELQVAFSSYEKTRDKETDNLKKEVQLYRTLSTAGITASTFSHESLGNPLKAIEVRVNTLKSRVPRYVNAQDQSKLMDPINEIDKATTSLSTLSLATLSLIRAGKRRIGKVSVHDTIEQVTTIFKPFMEGRTTTIDLALADGAPFLRTTEAALESIFANLINNSLAAFARAGSKSRKIKISTAVANDIINISFADSGPGLQEITPAEIWLPGLTTNPEGTGLGLTIVRDTIRDMGGTIEVNPESQLGGAEFTIKLPILGR